MSITQQFITHHDQQLYEFNRSEEGLVWWRCVHCGSNDEIASATARPRLLNDFAGDDGFDDTAAISSRFSVEPPSTVATPEPGGTVTLLAVALLGIILFRRCATLTEAARRVE